VLFAQFVRGAKKSSAYCCNSRLTELFYCWRECELLAAKCRGEEKQNTFVYAGGGDKHIVLQDRPTQETHTRW